MTQELRPFSSVSTSSCSPAWDWVFRVKALCSACMEGGGMRSKISRLSTCPVSWLMSDMREHTDYARIVYHIILYIISYYTM